MDRNAIYTTSTKPSTTSTQKDTKKSGSENSLSLASQLNEIRGERQKQWKTDR